MTAAGGSGGGFEGIDPPLLSQLMQSMKSGVGAATPVAAGYMSQFSALGLDTSRISRLQQDYSWAQGQQSMLQRRYDLASHQPSAQWENGMATSGAGELVYTTTQQAQKAGANAAEQFNDGKISAAQFLALLREHEYDPDWQTGAMRALGQEGLWSLKQDDAIPYGSAGQSDIKALALAVAAAMANGVTFPDPDDEGPGSEDISLLAPLLPYANFPPQVLATLGREAMAPGNSIYAPEVWAALAASPEGAAMFVKQNAPQIVWWINAGDHGGGMPDDQMTAFLGVLKAGTIDIKNTDPQLGAGAVSALVQAYDKNSGAHAPSQFDALYGQIIKAYWPDVTYAITSQVPGTAAPDGMKLTSGDWATFVDEAMRNPDSAAMLLGLAREQRNYWVNEAANGSSAADYGLEYQAGLVTGFFDLQASETYKSLGSPSSWTNAVANYAGDAANLAFDLVINPGDAAKTVVTDVSRDILNAAVSAFTKDLTQGNLGQQPDYSGFQSYNVTQATSLYNSKTPHKLATDPGLAALVNSAKDYDGGSFTAHINDPAKMTAAQRQAYNEWLSSPAVLGYIYASSDDGQNNGLGLAYNDGYNSYIVQSTLQGN
jgi:hypothetical protein